MFGVESAAARAAAATPRSINARKYASNVDCCYFQHTKTDVIVVIIVLL
jgi:hypothetical protein